MERSKKRFNTPPTSNVNLKNNDKRKQRNINNKDWLNTESSLDNQHQQQQYQRQLQHQQHQQRLTTNSLESCLLIENCYTSSFNTNKLSDHNNYDNGDEHLAGVSSSSENAMSRTSSGGRIFEREYHNNDKTWFLNPRNLKLWDERNINSGASTRCGSDKRNEAYFIDDDIQDFKDAEVEVIQANAYSCSAKISPYEEKLFELRREKLKLEEALLLKTKCEQELERTRFPTPKWYEMKTKQFTVEMVKHNNFMRNEDDIDLDALMDYRVGLYEKSKEYSSRFSN